MTSKFSMNYEEELANGLADGSLCPIPLSTGDPCGRDVHCEGICLEHAIERGICKREKPTCSGGCGNHVRQEGETCWDCRDRARRPKVDQPTCPKCGRNRRPWADLCYVCNSRHPETRDERRRHAQRAARKRWLAESSVEL